MTQLTKRYDAATQETLYYGRHASGAEIYLIPKKGYSKCHAMFATRYGSLDSRFHMGQRQIDIPDGTAHFLEHKLFEEEGGNVFDRFSVLGASANAFTSFDITAYHFSATQNFLESLKVLISFVQNPYFTPQSVQKEQGIIGQEIRMYEDDPSWQVYFGVLGCLYQNCYVTHDIAGTQESIATIDDRVLYDIYSVFYHPSNMILCAAGDFDVEETLGVIDSSLKAAEPLAAPIERQYPKEPDARKKDYTEKRLSVSMPLFSLAFKDTQMDVSGMELLKKEITTKILLEMFLGRSSRLYQKLYENAYINESFGYDYSAHLQYAFTSIEGEARDPKAVRDIIFAAIAEGVPDEQAFERGKRVVWGDYIKSQNSADSLVYSFVLNQINHVNYFDFKQAYDSITYEDVKARFCSHLRTENAALSVVLPV